MGKKFKNDKEFDFIDRLKHENKKLKQQLKSLRKMLDRYEMAEQKGLLQADGIIIPSQKREREEVLSERWACYRCEKGVLHLVTLGNRYYRQCSNCSHHTKSQPWNSNVEGIEKQKIKKK